MPSVPSPSGTTCSPYLIARSNCGSATSANLDAPRMLLVRGTLRPMARALSIVLMFSQLRNRGKYHHEDESWRDEKFLL